MSSSSSNSTVSADSPSKIPPSPPPPVSPSSRRTQANRENAQHSTGPRTKEGKSRSALNATIHGGFADKLILPNENQELFAHFYTDTLKALQPANALELSLAQRIISLDWRLRRIQAADTGLHLTRIAQFQRNADAVATTKQGQRIKDTDPELAPCFDADNLPEGFILAYTYDPPATASPASAGGSPRSSENPFERLTKTEHRLASMLHRALKDLQSLQKTRRENPAPVTEDDPYDPIEDDPDNNDQNDNEHDDDDHDKASPASAGGSSAPQDPNPNPNDEAAPQSAPSRTIQSENAQNEPMCQPDTPPAHSNTTAKQSVISLERQT
jgi:hypothetical protein